MEEEADSVHQDKEEAGSGDENEEDEEEVGSTIEELKQAVSMFVVASEQRLSQDKDYIKSIKAFTKSLNKTSSSRKPIFKRSLFTFAKEQSAPNGRRGKNGKLIPVQSTAKARRLFKHRGRVPAPSGRRHDDQNKRKQMVVTDETENVWYSLPSQKKRRTAHHPHSLAAAVSANRAAEKKH